MGIFGSREKPRPELTPKLCLAIGMVYITAADGYLSEVERYDLRKVLPDEEVLQRALEYCSHTPTTDFLEQCARLLDAEQKLCLLLNMADAGMADGDFAEEERQVLTEFQKAFGIADEAVAPHLASLTVKNARQIFRH